MKRLKNIFAALAVSFVLTGCGIYSKYVQTVINAGNQVNEAMADCQASYEKTDIIVVKWRCCTMLILAHMN